MEREDFAGAPCRFCCSTSIVLREPAHTSTYQSLDNGLSGQRAVSFDVCQDRTDGIGDRIIHVVCLDKNGEQTRNRTMSAIAGTLEHWGSKRKRREYNLGLRGSLSPNQSHAAPS
jgi:hypothetical protein